MCVWGGGRVKRGVGALIIKKGRGVLPGACDP